MTSSGNMQAAKFAIEQGWEIVPVQVWLTSSGGKASKPYVQWKNGGTRDFEQARDWWVQWPEAVVGILTKESGLLVIDLDLHNEDANGLEAWEDLVGQHNGGELPQTFTVRTPTGGLHIYFKNTDDRLKNSSCKLGPGIDTRGAGDKKGGLIYGPGSVRFDGEYVVEDDVPVADLPKWLADLLAPVEVNYPENPFDGKAAWEVDPTRRFTPEQAKTFCVEQGLQPLMNAQEGERNTRLNNAAIVFSHFGPEFWPRAQSEQILTSHGIDIGLEPQEIADTIRSGLDANTWRASIVRPQEAVEEKKTQFQREVEEAVRKREVRDEVDRIFRQRGNRIPLKDRILTRERLSEIPGVEPLIEKFLFRRSVAVAYGRRNVGKTFLALDMALSVATGRNWASEGHDSVEWLIGDGLGFEAQKGKVLWVAGEGAFGIRSRVAAWETQHGVTVEDFHVLNGSVELADGHVTDELVGIVAEEGYDLVVIDTLARNSQGLEENSNADMGTFFERIDRIKNAHDGTTVLVVHHQGKSDTVTDARGATVIEDAPDSVFKLSGDEMNIAFETTKQRDTVKAPKLTFHLESVESTGSAVILPGRGYVVPLDGQATASTEMQVREIFMNDFGNTGATGTEWKNAIMEKLDVSRATAQRYMNQALDGWDGVRKIEGGKGRADRFEVA